MATKKVSVESPVKLPVSFKEFAKNPIVGLMFLCIIAVGYLYVDIKLSNTATQKAQNEKIAKLEIKVDQLSDALRRSDSALSAATSKITVLQELGKIK